MKNIVRTGILALAFACLVLGYYTYLTRMNAGRKASETKVEKLSEKEQVLSADFMKNYPQTPREVVKWYNRILALYYSENLTDDEIQRLCDKTRILMDDELAEKNPPGTYILSVMSMISDIKSRGQKLVTTEVADSKNIEKKKVGGDSMAYVMSYYCIKEGNDYRKTYQMFALRKTKKGRYKILAFTVADQNGNT